MVPPQDIRGEPEAGEMGEHSLTRQEFSSQHLYLEAHNSCNPSSRGSDPLLDPSGTALPRTQLIPTATLPTDCTRN